MASSAWRAPRTAPPLAPGAVHVWQVPLDLDHAAVRFLGAVLTADERAAATGRRFMRERHRAITAHAVLRMLLSAYLAIPPAEITLRPDPAGKPRVAIPEGSLQYNLSHSDDLALMAFSRTSEVGVDLERDRPIDLAELVAAGFLSEGEIRALRGLGGRSQHEALLRCWTRKEAYLKAIGQGLRGRLADIEVSVDRGGPGLLQAPGGEDEIRRWRLIDLDPSPHFAACVVFEGPAALSCWRWTPAWLGVRT